MYLGQVLLNFYLEKLQSDLFNIVEKSKKLSLEKNRIIKADLDSKGINYGYIEVHPNGFVDRSNVDGIDSDLVLRPLFKKVLLEL